MKLFKERLKGFVAGILVTSLMMGTVAFAASTKIDVVFDNIKFMFDGSEKAVTGGRTLVYGGTVYAPVSFVGKALGKNVSYDGKTKTVWVGKKQGNFKYLENIEYARYDSGHYSHTILFGNWGEKFSNSNFKIASNSYLHGLGAFYGDYAQNTAQSISYNLDGSYKRLSAKIGIDDNNKNTKGNGRITIIGDDQEIYVSDYLKGGDLPRDLNVDISGVLRLEIKFEVSGQDSPNIAMGDAKLIQ